MLRNFEAHEFHIFKPEDKEPKRTGTVETYQAKSIEEAVQKVLYTKKLKDGKAKIGSSSRSVHTSQFTYAIVPVKDTK